MTGEDLQQTILKSFAKFDSDIGLRLLDPEKDRDLIKIFNDMVASTGKTGVHLVMCKGTVGNSSFYPLNASEAIIAMGEDSLRKGDEASVRASIAHELGHCTPEQIARTIKSDEVFQVADNNMRNAEREYDDTGDIEAYNKAREHFGRVRNTLMRFYAGDEFAADRFSAGVVTPEAAALNIETAIKTKLQNDVFFRNRLYPGKSVEDAIQTFEDDIKAEGKGTLHIERIKKLRSMGEEQANKR